MARSKLPRITLYTAPGCGHCRQLKAHLQRLKLPFQEFDVTKNRRAQNDWQRLGARGVPVLLVGSERLDGYDARRLDRLLREAGVDTKPPAAKKR